MVLNHAESVKTEDALHWFVDMIQESSWSEFFRGALGPLNPSEAKLVATEKVVTFTQMF